MISLIEILKIFRTNYTPNEREFQETWKSFWHKSEKLPISQIFGLQEEIAKVTTKFKGYYSTLADLQTAYPQSQNKKDFYAFVGSPYPGTVWKVKVDGGAWADTGEVPTQEQIDLTDYVAKADIKNELGNNPTAPIAQKVVTEQLNDKAPFVNDKGDNVAYANVENSTDGLFQIVDEKEIPIVEIDNKGNIRTPQTEMSNNGILEVLDEKENTIFKITKSGQIEMPLEAVSGLSEYIRNIGQIIDSEDRITNAFKPNDFGSKGFRIPFCTITKKGTIIVGCEVRYSGSGADHQKIDIGIKRSYDGGKTFADSQIVHANNDVVANSRKTQGVICVDEITGRIYLFAHSVDNDSTWESQTQDKWYEQNCDFLYKYSDDNGDTWSNDISIQHLQPELFPDNCVSLFPATGAGITMNDGTIVIPCQCKRATMYSGTEIDENKIFNIQSCFVYLTPENKKTQTWQVSSMVPTYSSENMIVEYEKGKLMINCRGYLPNGRRVFVTDDMGATWTAHETDKQLLEPAIHGGCQGTLIKIPIGEGEFKKEYGLFLNPQDVQTRLNMTIQVSADFTNWYKYKVIYAPYSFGYSCMAYRNGVLIALHEQADNNMMLYVLNSDINKIPKKIWE